MKVLQRQNKLFISGEDIQELKSIPNGVWLLTKENNEFCLVKGKDFSLPNQLYGDLDELADRYIHTFTKRKKSLGILLSGYKGSGKSLLAKLVAVKSKMPTILVTEYFDGSEFNDFISSIDQKVIVFIDEFEKVYDDNEKQNKLLSLLDGVFNQQKMFIFTANSAVNSTDISPYLINRPSRILYHKHFSGISEEAVLEIVEDLLQIEDNSQELIEITKALGSISMDSLISIIEEMNLYEVGVRDVLPYLNINVENTHYDVIIIHKGVRYKTTFFGHPLQGAEYPIDYQTESKEHGWWTPRVTYLIKMREMHVSYEENGVIRMENLDDNITLVFSKISTQKFSI